MVVSGHDAAEIDFGDDCNRACDFRRFTLSAAHAAEACRYEELACHISVFGDAEFESACTEESVEGAVHDALRSDVHPAAGGHLAVVGNTECRRAVKVFLVVVHADHETVGDDASGRQFMGVEESERMSAHHDQGLFVGHDFQIFFDQSVLHPVLADLSCLAVGDEFVGIEGHLEIQVVVNHDLEGFCFDDLAGVFFDRLPVEFAFRAEAITVNAAVLFELFGKFFCHLFVMVGMDIAQGVFYRERFVRFSEMGLTSGRTAILRIHFGIFRQLVIQRDGHCFFNCLVIHRASLRLFYISILHNNS